MTARVTDGTHVAKLVRDEIASLVAQAGAEGAQRPGLATVLIGDDPGSEADARNKRLACIAVGMQDLHRHLPAGSTQDAVTHVIAELAADPAVSGIVLLGAWFCPDQDTDRDLSLQLDCNGWVFVFDDAFYVPKGQIADAAAACRASLGGRVRKGSQ